MVGSGEHGSLAVSGRRTKERIPTSADLNTPYSALQLQKGFHIHHCPSSLQGRTAGVFISLYGGRGSPQELRDWATGLLESGIVLPFGFQVHTWLFFPSFLYPPWLAPDAEPHVLRSPVRACAQTCVHVFGVHACTRKSFLLPAASREPCCLAAPEKPAAGCELSQLVHLGARLICDPGKWWPVWPVSASLRSFQPLCFFGLLTSLRFLIFMGFEFPLPGSQTLSPGPSSPCPFPAAINCRLEVEGRGLHSGPGGAGLRGGRDSRTEPREVVGRGR